MTESKTLELTQAAVAVMAERLEEATGLLREVPAPLASVSGGWCARRNAFLSGAPARERPHVEFTCADAEKGAERLAAGYSEMRERAESAEAKLAEAHRSPYERSELAKSELRKPLELLAQRMCQTEGFILGALQRCGLTLNLLRTTAPATGEEEGT